MAKSKPQRTAIKLSEAARKVLGMSAVISFVAGVFAIFRPTSTEVGGVSLIVLAGVFGLLAAIGVFPSRVTAAGFTADMSIYEEVADGASPSQKRRIADQAEAASPEDPVVQAFSARMRTAALFEEAVLAELSRHPEFSVEIGGEAVRFNLPDPVRIVAVDAVVTVNGRRWAVEVVAQTGTSALRHAVHRLSLAIGYWGFAGVILITDREPPEALFGGPLIRVVVIKELSEIYEQILFATEVTY